MLEMPDAKETEEEKKARLKKAQAAAHKKWRESEKGKAYKLKQKLKSVNEPLS